MRVIAYNEIMHPLVKHYKNVNHPLIFWTSCSLSIIGLSYLSTLPSLQLYISVGMLLPVLLCWRFIASKRATNSPPKNNSSWWSALWTSLVACLLAWVWAVGWGLWQTEHRLPLQWEGKDVTIEGYVQDIPRHYTYSGRTGGRSYRSNNRSIFKVKVSKIVEAPQTQAPTDRFDLVRVSWYDKPAATQLIPGQLWRFTLRMRRPYTFMNPGGFDYEVWNLREGLDASAYVRGQAELLGSSNKMQLDKLRWRVHETIKESQVPGAGFISALMLGERSLISADENAVVRNTGIAHLLAISGLHLTLVGGGMFAIIFLILGRFRSLSWGRITPLSLAAIIALCLIWFYAFWTGFSLPAQRAAIMLSVFMLAIITKRFQNPMTIFFLAMTLVLFLDPLAATSGGFYLSFAALALVVLSFRYFIPRVKPARMKSMLGISGKILNYAFDLLITQLVLLGGLMPLALLFFNQLSLAGIFINMLAIPVTSFVIMPWILGTNLLIPMLPSLADISLTGLGWFIGWLYGGLKSVSDSPLAIVSIASPSSLAIIWVILAVPILIWWVKPYNYILAVVMLLPCLIPTVEKIPHGEFRVHFIDVGQGMAVHLQTKSHNLLYDTGASFSSGNDIGELVLVPYMRELGISKVDTLLVSHKDNDHSGGMRGLMKSIHVERLMLNFPYDQSVRLKPQLISPCRQGMQWQWDGVNFLVLHPHDPSAFRKSNDRSCVLLVESGENSVLLAGDITTRIEKILNAEYPTLQADLLQAPHHGSKTSSGAAWLSKLSPQYAVFSAGYRNSFNHPHPTIQARYDQLGIESFTSWRHGKISFHINNNSITHSESYRLSNQKYWHFVAP